MIWLLLPVAAVVFGFLIAVLADIRQYKKVDFAKLTSHGTRLAMYLSAIGILEVLRLQSPEYAGLVANVSSSFGVIEILTALGTMKQALGGSNPLIDAVESVVTKAPPANTDPFASVKGVGPDGTAKQQDASQ